ncbi:hypothetical protein NMY22_g13872 [Coprinellus aureogranulatus]|nr:hypothetical protein NMY22_g13872 [Coprinellus aureogranulatus]
MSATAFPMTPKRERVQFKSPKKTPKPADAEDATASSDRKCDYAGVHPFNTWCHLNSPRVKEQRKESKDQGEDANPKSENNAG